MPKHLDLKNLKIVIISNLSDVKCTNKNRRPCIIQGHVVAINYRFQSKRTAVTSLSELMMMAVATAAGSDRCNLARVAIGNSTGSFWRRLSDANRFTENLVSRRSDFLFIEDRVLETIFRAGLVHRIPASQNCSLLDNKIHSLWEKVMT